MAKIELDARDAYGEALASTCYDDNEVMRRLKAFLAKPSWETAAPIQRVGAALRVEAPDRARAAIELIVGELPWEQICTSQSHPWAFFSWALAPFAHGEHKLGQSTLLRLPIALFHLVRHAERPDAQTARAALAYLEYGDQDVVDLLHRQLVHAKPRNLRCALSGAPPEIAERTYALLAARLGDTAEQLRFVAQHGAGFSGLTPTAARVIARQHDLGPVSPGANGELGYGRDADDDARPLLEVAWRFDKELFFELLPLVFDFVTKKAHMTDLLDFLPWDEDREVYGETQAFRCRRLDTLVVSVGGKHGARGTGAAKRHKKAAQAEKDFRSKLAAKEKALGAQAAPPTGHEAEPEQALFEAARYGRRPAIRELLRQGATPDAHRDAQGRTALHHVCTDDPELVRLLIEAGADANARTAAGDSPLSLITGQGSTKPHLVECLRQLLVGGAQDAPINGMTALQRAAQHGLAELVELLLQSGAEPGARVESPAPAELVGKTALELARAGEHHAAARILELAG